MLYDTVYHIMLYDTVYHIMLYDIVYHIVYHIILYTYTCGRSIVAIIFNFTSKNVWPIIFPELTVFSVVFFV